MPPLTPPQEPCPASRDVGKLSGFDNWHTWHIKARMALQNLGLRHLLTDNGVKDADDPEALSQYDSDRTAGVRFLVDGISEDILASAYGQGWKPEDATVQSTLNTIETIVRDAQRQRHDEEEKTAVARKCLAGLTRMDLAAGAQTIKEYILTAKHCHDGLLAQYGDGASTVEDVLEQLFVVSLLEGLRTSQPEWYCEWMEKLKEGTLGHASTRDGVTEWLLAKDTATPQTGQINDATIAAPRARPSRKRARLGRGDRRRQRCRYCTNHHPQSTPHEETDCWFLNPHRASRKWQGIYKDEVAALRDSLRYDGKRKRSVSTSHRA
ncbi:hypothetical protein LEL_09560 [Akanthomyces lecanii RCEF 1005]|uniref:Uncharacterized protein n=1 Tax=Akanthomyces lecanii RCEF 1005 TaxID=1081108 RepID=A0A162MV48_CORDF|nr:hypothetical protein LEL_09560 [Akanthomyces lecanii RCEF 1005]